VEFDSLPIIGGTTNLMPHKHYGLSAYDEVGDIQLIKSTITRQLLDNAYVANNGRMVVLDGMVNMDDLLNARPNGIVRAKSMNAVQRLENPLLGAPFYNLLEYFDHVKQNRIGVTDFPNAVDPDAINAKATYVKEYKNAAMERVNLMARILAEGPVKALFWKIIELVSKHQTKPQVVKLRGRWVQVDPREWHKKFNMTVTVGLGTGDQSQILQGAMGIMQVQGSMVQSGMMNRTVTEQNIYQAAVKFAKATFPKDAEMFFTDPSTQPPPQPQPNPELLKIQEAARKADMTMQHREKQLQQKAIGEELDRKFEAEKLKFESMMKRQEDAIAAMLDSQKEERAAQAEMVRAQIESQKQSREKFMEAIAKATETAKQSEADKSQIILQGLMESMLQEQKAQHDHMARIHEAMLAPKEIVRDEKGKATGVRTAK